MTTPAITPQVDPFAEFGGAASSSAPVSTSPQAASTPMVQSQADPFAEFGGSVTPPTGTIPSDRTSLGILGSVNTERLHNLGEGLSRTGSDIWSAIKSVPISSVGTDAARDIYQNVREAIPALHAYENARAQGKGIVESVSAANDEMGRQQAARDVLKQRIDEFKKNPQVATIHAIGDAAALAAATYGGARLGLGAPEAGTTFDTETGNLVSPTTEAAATPKAAAEPGVIKQVLQGKKVAQPGAQSAVREGVQSSVETTNAAADRAAEPTRVHPPEIDPAVRDHARLNPFPGEDVKIKTFPGTPATETEAATNPTARITGPNGSSIELELDGKIARVKGIINSGKPGDGQRLYDNAIAWAKDSGYDTFEGDKVQTEAAKTAWGRVAERHNARMAEEAPHTPSIDLRGSRPAPEVAASDVTPVKTVKLPEATEPLTENSKTTIVDDHLDALEQQKSSAYKRMDDTAGFDVKALKDKLKTDKYNLKQLGSSDPDKTGRLVEAINDSTDRIAEANEKMKAAGIDPDYADALNKRWEAGQDYKASLLKRTNPDGSMNVKGLWDDAKKMRNDPEYGDRLEQWFGSKDAADAYVKALEKAHAEGIQAMKRQAFARQILWRVAGTTAAGAVGLGLYDATH
jgi:hypothetical protein